MSHFDLFSDLILNIRYILSFSPSASLPLSLTTVFYPSSFPQASFLLPSSLLFLSSLTATRQPFRNPLPSRILLLGLPALPEQSLGWTHLPSPWPRALFKAGFRRLSTQKPARTSSLFLLLHKLSLMSCKWLPATHLGGEGRLWVQLQGGQAKVQARTQTPSGLSPSCSCFSWRHCVHEARTLEGAEKKGNFFPSSTRKSPGVSPAWITCPLAQPERWTS